MVSQLLFCRFKLLPSMSCLLSIVPQPLLGLALLGLLQTPTLAQVQGIDLQQPQTTIQYLALSQVIYVNPNQGRDGEGGGTQDAPYRTITYALQTAQPGTVIQLTPGTYSPETGEVFPILIPDGVILKGDDTTQGQNILIFGGGNFVSPTFARQNATLRTAGNSQITGVTLTNPNTRGTGLWIEASSPIISDSTFVNNLRDGIFITAGSNPRITNNIFAQNQGNGISVARSGQGQISNNLFQNTGFGISINDQATPEIIENKIIENRDGVVVSHSAQPILRNNLIENNDRDGVVAIAQAQPNLGTGGNPGNNIIRNNARHDVYNATQGYTIAAVGNDIDPERIAGAVEFEAATSSPPELTVPEGTLSALSDIQGHWAQPYIEALVAQEIMSGFEDNSFRPDEPITRVQFAAVVQKAFAPTPQQSGTAFSDVPQSFWGYNAIQTAAQANFLSGYPDGTFRANEPLTRVQALAGLANGLGYSTENTTLLSVYQDGNQIPNWALQAIAGATEKALVVNYPQQSQLNPNQTATRADIAAFIYQALVNAGKFEAINSPYLVSVP
jgi:parallel beta-helix repeat protein